MPRRIQLRRTKGWRKPEGCVVVSRPSVFGNPWKVGQRHALIVLSGLEDQPVRPKLTAQQAVDLYRWWLANSSAPCATVVRPEKGGPLYRVHVKPSWMPGDIDALENRRLAICARLPELRGKDLGCWCPLDQPCHADVLLDLANRENLGR